MMLAFQPASYETLPVLLTLAYAQGQTAIGHRPESLALPIENQSPCVLHLASSHGLSLNTVIHMYIDCCQCLATKCILVELVHYRNSCPIHLTLRISLCFRQVVVFKLQRWSFAVRIMGMFICL